jgi:hypothetical protein
MIDDKKGADVLDQTASFFELIASSGLLTFDLEVASTPSSADVSYARIGESDTHYSRKTNTVIPNLVYTLWDIRASQANLAQVKQHDPLREKNHVVHFEFSGTV